MTLVTALLPRLIYNKDPMVGAQSSGFRAHPRRSRVAVVLVCAGLLLAGCGTTSPSAGVANLAKTSSSVAAGGTATTLPSGASAQKNFDKALKYSQCMRAHSVASFPDPNASGGIHISLGSGIDPNSSQFQAAGKACQQYSPVPHLSQAQIAQHEQSLLKFAACMRKNGVPNYPDPQFGANGAVTEKMPTGLDPNSPSFQTAATACGS